MNKNNLESLLTKSRFKKVTIDMDADQKWYLEEIAHASRTTQKEALYRVIDRYMNEFPLMDRP